MDPKEIVKRQQQFSYEVMQELRDSKSARVEILLATNFVELILKDFMEFLLQTDEGRHIERKLIVDILESRCIISNKFASDIRQIFQIRDAYAHKLSLTQANDVAEKTLSKLNCVRDESIKFPNWSNRSLLQKTYDASEWIFVHLIMKFDEISGLKKQ